MSNELYQIEQLVVHSNGRRQLGFMAAAEDLGGLLFQYLDMLDISEEWRQEIENARLEKLREMKEKDTDVANLLNEADKNLKKQLLKQLEKQDIPSPVSEADLGFNS